MGLFEKIVGEGMAEQMKKDDELFEERIKNDKEKKINATVAKAKRDSFFKLSKSTLKEFDKKVDKGMDENNQNKNMENEQNKETQVSVPAKNRWFAGYLIAGLIWTFAQSFKKNTIDELVILVIAILAGVFYHRLKSKIKIKNEAGKIAITFVILYIVSALLIGFLTALI